MSRKNDVDSVVAIVSPSLYRKMKPSTSSARAPAVARDELVKRLHDRFAQVLRRRAVHFRFA